MISMDPLSGTTALVSKNTEKSWSKSDVIPGERVVVWKLVKATSTLVPIATTSNVPMSKVSLVVFRVYVSGVVVKGT